MLQNILPDWIDRPVRFLKWIAISVGSIMVALSIMNWILDDFVVDGIWGLIFTAVTISIAQAIATPILYRFLKWVPAIVYPIVVFAASGAIILGAAWIDNAIDLDAFEVTNIETGIWIALGLTLITTLIGTLFSLDDVHAYDRFVTDPLKIKFGDVEKSDVPAFMFLEIDGLAGPVLEKAIAEGYAPNMQRWIENGSHTLTVWDPDLSCQTGASQAGILLGSNEDIPAFRWWDKERQELMVVSSMSTAKLLESDLSAGRGLLQLDGASRFNIFSGGASDSVGTFSNLNLSAGSTSYWAYFLNPYTVARLVSLFFQDVFREWWEEFQQTRKNVLPRLDRPWKYAFVRAGTTAAQLEVARFMVIADILRGKPSAYYTLFAYDEVAHHTGIDRAYTFKVLKNIDRIFGHLEEIAKSAPRPIHFVVLSDHGQSQGATFLQRYDQSLGELVDSLLPSEQQVTSMLDSQEAMSHIDAMLTESSQQDTRTSKITAKLLSNRTEDGVVKLGSEESDQTITADEVIVLASGNLGLVSFTRWQERMTLKQISSAFPNLINGLCSHPGVGFVMIQDEEHGGIVVSADGVYYLEDDRIEGTNPLEVYGPRTAHHLRRTNDFKTCPDILAISTYWKDTGEVAAFEELVGNHGGLGGTQRNPFVLHPVDYSMGDEIVVGAGDLNEVLRSWIESEQMTTSGKAKLSVEVPTETEA